MRRLSMLTILIALFIIGCSGGGVSPSSPDLGTANTPQATTSHNLWGLWQVVVDPEARTMEFTPLRVAAFHLNALPFLEPPAFVFLSLESLEFNGDIIDAGIGLRHPFLGLTEFTGFDVCGVFITNGSVSGFTDSNLMLAGEGDTRLLNADGYSRWWNPAEFPVNQHTMFSYNDGLLGTPDSVADYNSTLNGYKYFCDQLEANDSLDAVPMEKRGMFSAGQKNVRHYTIELGSQGLIFNYAVDASWEFPNGSYPWQAPDDFGPAANRAEAWRISVTEITNTLWNDGVDNGGDLSLLIDVYDWFNAELNTAAAESPGNLTPVAPVGPIGSGDGYSTYQIDIIGATPGEESIDILISVISEKEDFEGFIPGVNSTAYFIHTAVVSDQIPFEPADPVEGNVWLEVLREPPDTTITGLQVSWIDNGEPYFAVYADDDPFDAAENWEFVTEVELTTAQIDITNMPDFSGSGGYALTVRARSVSGAPTSESPNSQLCFVEMEDFDGGDNPNEWTIGYKNATYKWDITAAGQIDGSSALRIDPHPIGYWSVIISEPLPVIADSELSFIEFAHLSTTHWHYSAYTAYSIGHSTTPPPQGTQSTYNNFDGPIDFYAIMDGTFDWVMPSGPPPTGGWIPLVEYFGWNPDAYKFFGWRVHDGPHGAAKMSRVKHPWYKDWAPTVRAGMGYGTSVWENIYDWAEFDEIAVVVY